VENNRLLITIFLINVISINLFPQSIERKPYEPYDYIVGEKYRILQYRANIRQEPTRNSQVIAILSLNDEIEILENAGIKEEINEIWGFWYKIKYGSIIGYTFGGNLAAEFLVTDIDKNGINDYFYLRYSVDYTEYTIPMIYSYRDIIIFINNQRISTTMLHRYWFDTHSGEFIPLRDTGSQIFDKCIFENNNDHVLIKFPQFARDYEWTTVYKVNGNGEISFFEWTEFVIGGMDYENNRFIYSNLFYRISVNEEGEMEYVGNIGAWRNLD
jgi:hypothetical protein